MFSLYARKKGAEKPRIRTPFTQLTIIKKSLLVRGYFNVVKRRIYSHKMVFLHRKTNFFFTLPVIFCDVFEVIQKILEEFIFIDLKQV